MNDHQEPISLETLKKNAEEQLNFLIQTKLKIDNYVQNITGLIKHYNAKKSLFGHIALWYGEQEWWTKLIFSFALALGGTFFSIPLIISGFLSLTFSFFCFDHYTFTKEWDTRVAEDLEDQKQSIKQSVSYINSSTEQVNEILKTLCKMNHEMSTGQINLKNALFTAEDQIISYIEKLKEVTQSLQDYRTKHEELEKKLLDNSKASYTSQQSIHEQAQASQKIVDIEMENAVGVLNTNNARFDQVIAEINKGAQSLSSITRKITAKSSNSSSPENAPSTTGDMNQILAKAQHLAGLVDTNAKKNANLSREVESLLTPVKGAPPENSFQNTPI